MVFEQPLEDSQHPTTLGADENAIRENEYIFTRASGFNSVLLITQHQHETRVYINGNHIFTRDTREVDATDVIVRLEEYGLAHLPLGRYPLDEMFPVREALNKHYETLQAKVIQPPGYSKSTVQRY